VTGVQTCALPTSHPTTITHDNASSICFLPQESAGEIEGFPVVGVLHAKTLDPSKCTLQGEGESRSGLCLTPLLDISLQTS